MPLQPRDVFINCPFDAAYQPFFHAIVFTVTRSGFRARCALETDNAVDNRLAKICEIIRECRYGIHDISRTESDGTPPLPRFNMPLELGLFLGAQRFGGRHHTQKCCIVLDRERYRFQRFVSDIAGQDIHSHDGDVPTLILKVATWLRTQSDDPRVPGGRAIAAEYAAFGEWLPAICAARKLGLDELTFGDFARIAAEFIAP
jgi:hypothetical protein